MKISDEYLAGFLDGEGYLGLMRRRGKTDYGERHGYYAAVKTAQKEQDAKLIYAIHQQYGGYIQIKKANGTSQQAVCWETKGKLKVAEFLPKIIPYMIVKKEQAELLLEFCQLGYIHPFAKDKTALTRAVEIYEEMRRLKYKSPATTE